MNYLTLESPVGALTLAEEENAIVSLFFAGKKYEQTPTELLRRGEQQLNEYFAGERQSFELPLDPRGTDFQKRVWRTLLEIPYGETRTYGQLAARLGNPGAARAVGGANNKNPLPILIPCHRVIGAGNDLVGYAGGLSVKACLLHLENAAFKK